MPPSKPTRRRAALRARAGLLALVAAAGCASQPSGAPDGRQSPVVKQPPLLISPAPGPGETAVSPAAPAPGPPATLAQAIAEGAQRARVAKVVDGDTIWVEPLQEGPLATNAVHKVRILEIDTPESTTRRQCYGKDAAEFARRELAVGSVVYLLADREDKDRYGRYLRYVWKENGEFYNEKAVRLGYAKAVLYRPNDRYIEVMRRAEAQARASGQGFWTACVAGSSSRPQAAGPQQSPQTHAAPATAGQPYAAAAAGCDGSYPDFCIPPAPPDLDCADVAEKNFTVQGADPHRFDGGGTPGVGCEA